MGTIGKARCTYHNSVLGCRREGSDKITNSSFSCYSPLINFHKVVGSVETAYLIISYSKSIENASLYRFVSWYFCVVVGVV